ncbi:MAG: NlpC/P60 family protein [Pseudomonadota bacterium]
MTGEEIVVEARRWIGTPYHHGASVRGVGCDCLGLVRGLYRALVGPEPEAVPAYTADWGEIDRNEPLLAAGQRHFQQVVHGDALPGDLVLFRWRQATAAKHLALLSASDRIIHAYDGAGVVEVSLTPSWKRREAAVFRFPDRNVGDAT